VFDYLPIAAVIDNEVLCVHGGLSPDVNTIDQIRLIERNQEVPNKGPFCDLLWSDPCERTSTWSPSPRLAGYLFGEKVTQQFNQLNGLQLICRAHQLVLEGHQYLFSDKSLVTVWSAPNYCYRSGNVATIVEFDQYLDRSVRTFEAAPESGSSEVQKAGIEYFL